MLTISPLPHCCGLRELGSLSMHGLMSRVAMKGFAMRAYGHDYWENARFRHVIFSQAHKNTKYGELFASLIKEKGLGSVVNTPFQVNPNSGNDLKAWIWTVDHDAVKKWAKEYDQEVKDGKGIPSEEVQSVSYMLSRHSGIFTRAPQPYVPVPASSGNRPDPAPGPAAQGGVAGRLGNAAQAQGSGLDALLRDIYLDGVSDIVNAPAAQPAAAVYYPPIDDILDEDDD